MDSGATVSCIKESYANLLGLKIHPNAQFARLADAKTLMESVGEIHIKLHRNNFTAIYRALVMPELHADVVGGTTFIKENKITQDFDLETITLHKKYTVPQTSRIVPLPRPIPPGKPQIKTPDNHLVRINFIGILDPGQHMTTRVPQREQARPVRELNTTGSTYLRPTITTRQEDCWVLSS